MVRMKASNQRLQDKNRIANKIMREHNRYLNATSELYEEILNKLGSFNIFKVEKVKTKFEIVDKTAIVQLTDLHLGETVTLDDTLGFNEYGIEVGSKRLWKFAREIEYILGDTVSEIVVAMTGDLLNSDRRVDEMLTNTANRSEVFVQALQVLSGFLIDLARRYKITVLSVVGNESRIDQDPPYRNPMHNYDFLIHKCLSMLLNNCGDRITFLDISRNYETIYKVGGLNILFSHGYKYKPNMLNKVVMKYNMMGTLIDYVITGHIHTAYTEESQGRSGSLVGSNNYSIFRLHAIAKATQILYTIKREESMNRSSISPMIIDLQEVADCGMYKFDQDVCKIN
jgi:predicted phosphodiesterase